MSGQMSDVVVIDSEEYAIVEPGPDALFDVRAHGVKPVMMHTANTRGVFARYRIEDGALILSDLQVGAVEAPPVINDVEPTTDEYGQTWTYLKLDLPIQWTGDLIIGAAPILDLYVHAGFLPAWHYERIQAFDIENGLVQSSEDRSAQVAEFRAERTGASGAAGATAAADEDEGIFERFLDSIKLRLGLPDDN